MNKIPDYCHKINFNYLFVIFLSLIYSPCFAQGINFGAIYIGSDGEMAIHDVTHNFHVEMNGKLGIIGTERVAPQGYLSFAGTANHVGAIDSAHVDGYSKTYRTTPFIFPIGDNNKYRPAAVSTATTTSPASAAYFLVSPNTATTTSFKGGLEPVLPSGEPFNTALIGIGIQAIDTLEYWDINGATAAKITLTWNITSAITTMTANNLALLTILGWDGAKWVKIPSTFDNTSLLGGLSNTASGSITTDAVIVPDFFSIYTLGALSNLTPDLIISLGQPLPVPIVAQTSFIPVTVTNIGLGASVGIVTAVIQIPNATLFGLFPINNNGWICSTTGTTATCTSATGIAIGGITTFNVPFMPVEKQEENALIILPAVVSGGSELMADAGNNASSLIITPNVASANLSVNFIFSSTVFTVGASKTFIINLTELGNIATNGTVVEIFIPKSVGFTYDFNVLQTSVIVTNLEAVDNLNWSLTTKPTGLLLKSIIIIPANGTSKIAITVTANTAGTLANLIANITPNGGGETNKFNDSATLALSVQN